MTDIELERDPSKTDLVYSALRERIRSLTLLPGTPLRKEDIAAELGVSRAPISGAITRLAEEALVDIIPQRGSFVAPIRREDVAEYLFVRTGLETAAVREVTARADDSLIQSLEINLVGQRDALSQQDLETFHALDEEMHEIILRRLNRPLVTKILKAARVVLDRPRRLALPKDGRGSATLEEHRRLVDAIASRDPDYAAATMRHHMRQVQLTIERALDDLGETVDIICE